MSTDFEDAFQQGAKTKIVSQNINGIDHVLVPAGCTLQSMEKLMEAPQRIVAHPKFSDVEGFAEYIKGFKEKGTRIFVDEDSLRFTTIFDAHEKDQPKWCDHKASLELETAHEWNKFVKLSEKPMSPNEFAEFLEDHISFIDAGKHNPADLISMAQKFKIKVKGDVQVEESLHAGLKTLMIVDDSKVTGTNKAGKEVKFPEQLAMNLRFFKNCKTYSIKVFLRYRASNDSLNFFIKIPNPEILVEEAFNAVLEQVQETTKLPTLKGSLD